jgi:hypothetical protein
MRDTELRELFAEFERLDSSANHALSLDEMGRFLRRVGMKVSRDEAQAYAPRARQLRCSRAAQRRSGGAARARRERRDRGRA